MFFPKLLLSSLFSLPYSVFYAFHPMPFWKGWVAVICVFFFFFFLAFFAFRYCDKQKSSQLP